MSAHNENLLKTWAARLRGAVLASTGVDSVDKWLINNTSSPSDPEQPFSFFEHEWQLGVFQALKDKNHLAIEKSAQVGASEVSARMALALPMVKGKAINLIYALPSAGFSRKFVGSRVDPIIRNSPLLRGELRDDFNNLEVKGLGDSFVFFAGASVENQAISTPCQVLIVDEYNFCDTGVLSVFASRLLHCKPGEETVVNLSTPTLPAYGISKLYEEGDKRSYLLRHDECGKWVEVRPETDIVVPGWEGNLLTLTRKELEQSQGVEVGKAWVRCRECGGEVYLSNLVDADKRQWVAEFPERERASFHVSPLDCAAINPPGKIAGGVRDFSRQVDYLNYRLGVAAASSDAMLSVEALERARREVTIHPNVGASGCVMGVDVGKVSHLVVGKKVDGKFSVVWIERVLQDGEGSLQRTIRERMGQFGVSRLVIDSQPDLSVPRELIGGTWAGRVLASYFVTGAGPRSVDLLTVDEKDGVVKINRTRMIDELVRELNNGDVRLLESHADGEMFIRHLMQLRRIEEAGLEGVNKARWISVSDSDHYFFALLYAFAAAHSLDVDGGYASRESLDMARLISKVKLRLV